MSDEDSMEDARREYGFLGSLMPPADSPAYAAMLPTIDRIKQGIKQAGEATQRMRLTQFEALVPAPGGAVFLGDSITEGGLWSEWFPDVSISNRGIGGDTVAGVTARLDSALNAPALVSILVGTNDLSSWDDAGDTDEIAQAFAELLRRIRAAAPSAVLLINAVMPRTSELAGRISSLNDRYREMAADFGATYLDTWDVLAEPDGLIRGDCSLDALHLTGEGYRRWTQLLRPHLEAAFADGPTKTTALETTP